MANIPIITFNAGVLTEQVDARSDIDKYRAGCRKLQNMLPRIYGSAERRPGSKHIYDASNSPSGAVNTTVRMMPFIYSTDIAYEIEFGDLYARFYYNDEVLNDGVIENVLYEDEQVYYEGDKVKHHTSYGTDGYVWITTPYRTAHLVELQVYQIADVIRIVHPNYPPMKLSRTGVRTFVLEEIPFNTGPFLTRNDLIDPDNPSTVTMSCNSTNPGSSGILTAGGSVFINSHVGALFKLVHAVDVTVASLSGSGTSDAISVKGTMHFNTHGRWVGTAILQRNENEGGWEDFRTYVGNNDRNVQLPVVESEVNVQYRINATITSGSFTGDISIEHTLKEGVVKVKAVINSYTATVEVFSEIENTNATKRWAEGAWSLARGFPAAISFFDNRCVYAGASIPLTDDEFVSSSYPQLRV